MCHQILRPKREANRKLREELKSRRSNGEEVMIRNGKIVDVNSDSFRGFRRTRKDPPAMQEQQLRHQLKFTPAAKTSTFAPAQAPSTVTPQTSSGLSARRGSTLVSDDTLQPSSRPPARRGDIPTQQKSRRTFARRGDNLHPTDTTQSTSEPAASRSYNFDMSSEGTDDAQTLSTKDKDLESDTSLPTKTLPNESKTSTAKQFFLNCYYTNANSITNKGGEFEANIDMWKPKIIGVSES